MTLLYTDDRFRLHETGRHPECPARLTAILKMLDRTGLRSACTAGNLRPATTEELSRVHAPRYITALEKYTARGGGQIESDTVVSSASEEIARLAAGSACAAVDAVLAGETDRAICLFRPPGHHALADSAMGFCLYNNVAVAAAHARAIHHLDRVLIIDWDVHHGNGTQEIFYDDPQITFFSSHRWPFYPGSGANDETGTGKGLGHTINLPLTFGVTRSQFHAAFATALEKAVAVSRPQLILLGAGFDAHAADPIGSLGLESEDFATLTRLVIDTANTHADGRLISLLEGGYNIAMLAECVEAHLRELTDVGLPAANSGSEPSM